MFNIYQNTNNIYVSLTSVLLYDIFWCFNCFTHHKKSYTFSGVVEVVRKKGVRVSYLSRSTQNNDQKWVFPESSSTFFTPLDQVISSNFAVEYTSASCIRCSIPIETALEIENNFNAYLVSLDH